MSQSQQGVVRQMHTLMAVPCPLPDADSGVLQNDALLTDQDLRTMDPNDDVEVGTSIIHAYVDTSAAHGLVKRSRARGSSSTLHKFAPVEHLKIKFCQVPEGHMSDLMMTKEKLDTDEGTGAGYGCLWSCIVLNEPF